MTTKVFTQSTLTGYECVLHGLNQEIRKCTEAISAVGPADLPITRAILEATTVARDAVERKIASMRRVMPPPGPSNILVTTPNLLPFPKDVTKQ